MILITGSNGFIGSALFSYLKESGVKVRGTLRKKLDAPEFLEDYYYVGELNSNTSWKDSLSNVKTVVHTAAIVHREAKKESKEILETYREVNTAGTINLAKQSAEEGVKRFIFISTIKVNGESTSTDNQFKDSDHPNPIDAYSISKFEAELGLQEIAQQTEMEVVIIRPTLIYGPGVKANFLSLFNFVSKNYPLPFGLVKNNRRSFLYIDNLLNLIKVCIDHPNAANQLFLVSDDSSFSTYELISMMRRALNQNPRLFNVPLFLFKLAASISGNRKLLDKLLGSLEVDIKKTCDTLNWEPIYNTEEGLKRTAISLNIYQEKDN
jgi:UDP-glucose 4-epimerase